MSKVMGYQCDGDNGCEAIISKEDVDSADSVKVYECPECGEQFKEEDTDTGTGNRSPCCGKFGSKILEGPACPECGEAIPIGENEVVIP